MREDTITEADVGKRVYNADGTVVGHIVDVDNGKGYVQPDPGVLETLKAKLGWGEVSDTPHPLDEGSIERITEDAIYLRGTL
jgi:hypothetical protein